MNAVMNVILREQKRGSLNTVRTYRTVPWSDCQGKVHMQICKTVEWSRDPSIDLHRPTTTYRRYQSKSLDTQSEMIGTNIHTYKHSRI